MLFKENFYPPIVDTYIPAFKRSSQSIRIYFSLSQYNSVKDIDADCVQVKADSQYTNKTVLHNKYRSGIKLCKFHIDETVQTDNKYYIELEQNDFNQSIVGKDNSSNNYYKVQIRFTHVGVDKTDLQDGQPTSLDWYNRNLQYFSEWSKVSLIKMISDPTLFISGLDGYSQYTNFYLPVGFSTIVGQLFFDNVNETERLKEYSVTILNEDGKIIEQGLHQLPDALEVNNFTYNIETILSEGQEYTLIFTYVTTNGYTETKEFQIHTIVDFSTDLLNKDKDIITVTPNEELGCMTVNFIKNGLLFSDLMFKRTSSKSDFTKWEDIHKEALTETGKIEWQDHSIESGVIYQYGVQVIKKDKTRGNLLMSDKQICNFEYAFLNNQDKTLCIKYNTTFDSISYVNKATITETLGSKYPFIVKNGKVQYRTASMSTTISYLSDKIEVNEYEKNDKGAITNNVVIKNLFLTPKDLQELDMFAEMSEHNDLTRISENKFKDMVMEFIQSDNNLKLLRTPAHGNMIVAITDIALEAFAQEGYVCTLTATITEIDEYNIKNLQKYHLLRIDYTNSSQNELNLIKQGQIKGSYNTSKEINSEIEKKYKYSSSDEYEYKVQSFNFISLDFVGDSYKITYSTVGQKFIYSDSGKYDGWLIRLNKDDNSIIYIPKDEEPFYLENIVDIEVLKPNSETDIPIYLSYEVVLAGTLANRQKKYFKIDYLAGQYKGNVTHKYNLSNILAQGLVQPSDENKYKKLLNCEKLKIESTYPGAIKVKDALDDDYYTHSFEPIYYQPYGKSSNAVYNEDIVILDGVQSLAESDNVSFMSTRVGQCYIYFPYSLQQESQILVAIGKIQSDNPVKIELYSISQHRWIEHEYSSQTDYIAIDLKEEGYNDYGLMRFSLYSSKAFDIIATLERAYEWLFQYRREVATYALDLTSDDVVIQDYYFEGQGQPVKNSSGVDLYTVNQRIFNSIDDFPIVSNQIFILENDLILNANSFLLDDNENAIVAQNEVDIDTPSTLHLQSLSGQELIDNCTLYTLDIETGIFIEVNVPLEYVNGVYRIKEDAKYIILYKPFEVYAQYLYEVEEGEYLE